MTPPVLTVAALSPGRYADDLAALETEEFDVLVIGGGVVGAGVALDAATRGLSVAIVEAEDWAAGTSSSSSKLIHGGLRYVRHGELALVREALRERAVLLEVAPHLVHPIPFLFPFRRRIARPYFGAGVALYDLLARVPGSASPLPRARHLGASAARASAPALRRDRVAGGIVYFDAQVDDARFVLGLVRTAASYGARVVSRARVVGLDGGGGRIRGATIRLGDTGGEFTVRARSIVSASGAWTGDIQTMAQPAERLALRRSKGVHLVVARESIDSRTALIMPTAHSVLFVLPWGAHWIVGTTDTPWSSDGERPRATASDVEYLLGQLNGALAQPIGRGAVQAVYAGLRPLLEGRASATTKLSREHAVAVVRPGLALVAGGKFTTYRVMAKDALDAAVASAGIAAPPSRTESVEIAGATGLSELSAATIGARTGLADEEVDRLLGRYGSLVGEVLDVDHRHALLPRLTGTSRYLHAEVRYAVTHEGARHIDDVLLRRTRAAIETGDRAAGAAEEVASLMAPLLGWTPETASGEVAAYRAAADAELPVNLPQDGQRSV